VSTVGTIVLYTLAAVGALCILGSVGVWIFVGRFADPGEEPTPASEVVARHTGNVRVIPPWGSAYDGPPSTGDDVVAIDAAEFRARFLAAADRQRGDAS
jgi:hypothetical protein